MPQNRTTNTIKTAPSSSNAVLPKVYGGETGDQWEARRWERGFLRLWIASALTWVGVVGVFALGDSHNQEHLELAGWALMPPLFSLAIVLALIRMRRNSGAG